MPRWLTVIAIALALLAFGCSADEPTTTGDTATTTTAGDLGEDPIASTGVGPGISVAEALTSGLPGPFLVNGFIVTGSDGTVYLAETLAESMPPQPAGAQLTVEGLDLGTVTGLTSAQDTSWTDEPVQLLGTVTDGVLTVTATSSG